MTLIHNAQKRGVRDCSDYAVGFTVGSNDELGGVLAGLGLRPKRAGRGWQCRCPVHEDDTPSLSAEIKDGRFLAYCHAGCPFVEIRAALGGIRGADPFAPASPEADRSVHFLPNWLEMVRASFNANGPTLVQEREERLGVPRGGLIALGAIWSIVQAAVACPMFGANGRAAEPIGARVRSDAGGKWAVRGSRSGLFVPVERRGLDGPLFLPEGLTDTAALVGLGMDAIGRPSCTGGRDLVRTVVAREPADRPIVIVADADEPGRLGARLLAEELPGRRVSVLTPPSGMKDVREWVGNGATAASVRWAAKHRLST